jgi:hypothetical protein
VVYALGEQDVVLVDTGSGREIGRTAKGVLTADGQRIYASSEGCRENSRRTAVLAIDALTLDAEELGCVDGRQEIVAVSPERNNLLISDGPQSLAVYGVAERAVKGSIAMPAGAVPLGPARAVSNENRYLFTAGTGTGEAVTVVRVDMTEVRIDGSTTLEAARGAVGLAPLLEGGRVLVYEAQAGRLYDVEPGGMGVIRQLDMTGGGPGGEGRLSSALAVDATGRSAFVALPGGGIAEVDLAGFEVRGILAAELHFSSVAVSSDGQLLYAAERAAGYAVVERETGKVALRREPLKLTGFLRVEAGQ